jgi:Protein of unknown function (DUF2950)
MKSKTIRFPALALGLLFATWLVEVRCENQPAIAQRTFTSPAEATQELVNAVKAHDRQAMRGIFGPEVTNLWTGDETLDERHFDRFANDLAQRCDVVLEGNFKVALEIGPEKWPFPIPLIQTNGAWMFDTIAGEDEIINRHIGRDEYYAIGVCRAYVNAQREYAKRFAGSEGRKRYAEKLKSTSGENDGLYWPADTNSPPSPLAAFVAEAESEGYDWSRGRSPRSFHGYLFKILTRQGPGAPGGKMNYFRHGKMIGGFALVAYPVRWGESGIMTFIVGQDGVVYERSLGKKSARAAAEMKEYNPDGDWVMVRDPGIPDLTADNSVSW